MSQWIKCTERMPELDDDETVNQGNAFRTEADAQKWLDFMESQIEE